MGDKLMEELEVQPNRNRQDNDVLGMMLKDDIDYDTSPKVLPPAAKLPLVSKRSKRDEVPIKKH